MTKTKDEVIDRICDAFGHLFDALDRGAGDPPGTTWEDRSHIRWYCPNNHVMWLVEGTGDDRLWRCNHCDYEKTDRELQNIQRSLQPHWVDFERARTRDLS